MTRLLVSLDADVVRSISSAPGPCGRCGCMRCVWVSRAGQTMCADCDDARPLLPAHDPVGDTLRQVAAGRMSASAAVRRLEADSTDPDEPRYCAQCGATEGEQPPCDCHLQDPGDDE